MVDSTGAASIASVHDAIGSGISTADDRRTGARLALAGAALPASARIVARRAVLVLSRGRRKPAIAARSSIIISDNAPPYFTMFLTGHIVLPLALITEHLWHPTLLVHLSLWVPLAILITVMILPKVKGAIVALQWALRMHGFEYAALAQPRDGRPPHCGGGLHPPGRRHRGRRLRHPRARRRQRRNRGC
jgi:hypothetical protein